MGKRTITTLWHYTSIEGLKSILSSKMLLAKRIDFFTDTTEYDAGKNIVDDVSNNIGIEIINSDNMKSRSFAFCMSEDKDSIRQWQKRCMDGGVAIGFKMDVLEKLIQAANNTKQDRFIYLSKQKYCQKCFAEYVAAEFQRTHTLTGYVQLYAPLFYKDQAKYSWEKEYRLTLVFDKSSSEYNIFNEKGYVAAYLFSFQSDLIDKIMVSPYGNIAENISNAKAICYQCGFPPEIVIPSSHCRNDN